MKKLYHFILLIIISFAANAQIVEISANPGSSGNIVIGQSNYHVSESIYLDAEIGASNFLTSATSITKISFSVNANTSVVFPVTINNVKISIKNTTATSLTTGTNNTTGYTVVFSGSITFSGTGWKILPLSTSFVRTAGQNLQLKIERSDNISNSGLVFDAARGNSTSSTAISSRRYNGTASITTNTALTPTFFRPAIQFIRPFPTDAQATTIINPVNSCFSSNQTIKVAVKNNGTTAIPAGAASVNLSITGANTSITTSTNSSIIPVDSTALVVFSGINLNIAGLNQETAIVNVAADGYRANDTATSSVTTATILSSLPQTEDVEGQFNVFAYLKAVTGTNAWTVLSFISNTGAFNNGWNLDSLTTRPNGTGADFFIFDSYDAAPGTVSRLFSNCITLPSTGASRVSFWMSHDSAFATNLDSLYVSVSNNKGASWTRVKGFRRPDASLIEYAWIQDSVDISAYNGQTIQLAFEGVSAFGNAFGLDDIDIYNVNICVPTYNTTTITSCNSYTWVANNNTLYTSSGTYVRNYTNACGVASADTLKLTINQGTYSSVTRSACVSYTWPTNGLTYSSSGTYIRNYTNASGCPSADTLKLTINQGTFTSSSVNSCGTYTWSINSQTYSTSGTYIRNYNNGSGCASADTLKLTINRGTFTSNTITSCGSYTWTANGQTYNSSGIYIRTYNNSNGCASADTLKLTINQGTFTSTSVTNCGSYTWSANGQTYLNSGTYVRNYTNASGCPSADTLKLTLNQGTFTSTTIVRCGSYTWPVNSQTYNASGVYLRTYTNILGCPSVDTLKLTINQGTFTSTTATNCGNYLWTANGVTYTTSGVYIRNYTNGQGCPSADTLKLTINQGTFTSTTVIRCDSYIWSVNNQTYTTSGVYVRPYNNTSGCFSADTLKLTINRGTYTSTTISSCGNYVWNSVTYTSSGTYTRNYTNVSGCPSTDTLKLTISQGTFTSTSITNCGSYTWNGNNYTTSGTYTRVYLNSAGCVSADTLKLIITQGTFTSTSITNCGSYIWNGSNYTSSGTYTRTYINSSGCSSTDTLKLTLNQGTFTTSTVSACGSYIWNGITYTTSGTFTRNYINGSGCNSTDTLKLTINQGTFTSSTVTACGSYVWNGNTYTSGGTYTRSYSNGSGCPSTDTLKLTINQGSFTSTSITNCGSYIWNGNNYTSSGTYTKSYINGSGCASVDTLKLTINQGTFTSTSVSACGSYTWNGNTYTSSGTYTRSYNNGLGCTSTDTLKLIINQGTFTSTNISACASYVWNGSTYTSSGTYTRSYNNGLGCTSTDTLKLTINQGTFTSTSVTSCGSYVWNGSTYTSSGTYTRSYNNGLGCASTDTLKLTINQGTFTSTSVTTCGSYVWNGSTYTSSGTYTRSYINGFGCASTDTLKLTINQGTYTSTSISACGSYVWNGNTYTSSGIYTKIYTNNFGCASADTLKLTINQGTYTSTSMSACGSYVWNGTTYTSSGIYTKTYTNGSGCISIDTLRLTINSSTNNTTSVIKCGNYTWQLNSQNYTVSGTYTYNYVNATGCASTDTLHLTLTPAINNTNIANSCGPYTWTTNGNTYTTSGIYYYNNINCGTTDTLKLTVNQGNYTSTTVINCGNYVWNGTTYSTSGTYTKSYTNATGCFSVDTLKLTVNQGTFTSLSVATCGSYVWNGNTYTSSGTYTRNYNNGLGCASTDTLKLIINQGNFTATNVASCGSYNWNGNTYNTSGTYTRTYINTSGCTSVDTLKLTVNQGTYLSASVSSCGSYVWNGVTYTSSGVYTKSYTNSFGCASADTLKLTINQGTFTSTSVTNCGSYIWNGNTYSSSGIYTKNYTNNSGCPSTDTLKLTVNQGTFLSTSVSSCGSYVWNGNTYTSSGIYIKNYTNNSGCASADTLKLTINQGIFTSISAANCGSYVWNGITYTSSGTYTRSYVNGLGCNSVDTLKLTINQGTFASTSIATCGSYVWNGNTYTTSGTYTRAYINGLGCASADTLKLTINTGTYTSTSITDCERYTWNGITYTSSGIYTKNYINSSGCSSVDTLKLNINHGTFTSNNITVCGSYVWNGITYTSSGIYTKNYTNNFGCFSVDTLKLTINQGTHSSTSIVSCENYVWNGNNYTLSGTYTRAYTNGFGCSSVDTLKLTINRGTFTSTVVTACENYIWNGINYTTSGVYTKTYSNVDGCFSADTLKLTLNKGTYNSTSVASCGSYIWNATGQTYSTTGTYTRSYTNGYGCLSVDTLKLIINQGTYNSTSVTNCGSYTWPTNGQTYNATGNYIYTYFNASGCPSADTLKLTINQGTFTSTSITNCGSYIWPLNGQTYSTSGTYTRTYVNNSGCSSTDTLKLIINQGTYSSTSITSCGTYTWPANGQTYNASGNYIRTFTNGLGCPSADTLKLTLSAATYNSASVTTCGSYTWPANGQTYSISGVYIRNYINGQGCSSVDTLKLMITLGTFTSTTITACDSYTWNINGQTYTASGIYLHAYNNNFGCPSVDTLKLTINQGTFTSTNITACENYVWPVDGLIYDTTGTYIRNYTNGTGCPSADTLHLWINHASNNSFTITSCDEYTWASNGQTYTSSGTYTRNYINGLGCSSTDTLKLTINNHTDSTENVTSTGEYIWPLNGELYTESGTYYYTISEPNRCILVKLNLIISSVKIYPNPTTGLIKLNLSSLEIPDGTEITISVFDRIGRLVKKQTTLSNILNEVDLTPYTNGLYIIRVQSPERIYISSKIIKQSIK